MHNISPQISSIAKAHKGSSIWISEAENALRYLSPYLQLPKNSRILEVGSGACVLLGHLALTHKQLRFSGIEPIGPGFNSLRPYIDAIKSLTKAEIFEGGYEEFHPKEKFDLIFLVNVFEHLPDWKNFLKYADEHLAENGKCVILCPNYGFPIESHYGLPIIFTKNLTEKIFSNYIKKFDIRYDCDGLWSSLNFVKYSAVKNEARNLNLSISFNREISFDFVQRLKRDREFRARHEKIATIAQFFEKSGIFTLLKQKIFWNWHPYMHLEISRGG